MIQDKLENALSDHVSQTGRYCIIIIMHPQTWLNLFKEVSDNDGMEIYRHDPTLRYKGIVVLRSLDVVDGVFIIA